MFAVSCPTTIVCAIAFNFRVRNGIGWFHYAQRTRPFSVKLKKFQYLKMLIFLKICTLKLKRKVRKVFDLFAQVSLNPYRSSTACRLTGCSFRDLITSSNLGVGFPLRCFQRLSFRNVATRRYHGRDNRHTRDSSREVLSYCPQLSSKLERFHWIESELSHAC